MKYKKYTLQELATIKYGKNQRNVIDENGKFPIYGTGGLMGYASKPLYEKPSVLIGRKGTIDKVRFVTHPFWTVDTLFYTEVNAEIVLPHYLFYALSLMDLKLYNEGTTIPSLRTETLNRIEFDIPSIDEQKNILSVLEPIDEKILLNDKINGNLLQQTLCLYATLVDGKAKNGCIGDYCTVKSGFAFKSKWWQVSGVPVVKISSINQDYLNLSDCSYVATDKISFAKDFIVLGGDLLIAMTGATIGKFAMVPKTMETILVNQRVGKFFLGNNPVSKIPFIYCTLKQPEIVSEVINRGQGSAQPNISASDIMSIPCVIPQAEVIDKFNQETSPMFELIINNQLENAMLSSARGYLLPMLMSGKIDVSNIDL